MFIVEIFVLLSLLCLVTLAFWHLADCLFCREDLVTNKNTTKKIADFINKNFPQKSIFLDLGSSRGGFVLDISEKCPQLQITGIDNSLLRILISKFRAYLSGKEINFIKDDIYLTDVSKAKIIYVYIPLFLLPRLAVKLDKELTKGTMVITTCSVPFEGWQPNEVISKNSKDERNIFIYKAPFIIRIPFVPEPA